MHTEHPFRARPPITPAARVPSGNSPRRGLHPWRMRPPSACPRSFEWGERRVQARIGRARTCRRAGQVRGGRFEGVGERAGLELKASESTVPAAPTRKARHDHLTRKLTREARRESRRKVRRTAGPHRTARAQLQHAAARTHRPLRAALLPLLLRAHRPAPRRQLGHRRQWLLPRAQPLLRPTPRARRRRQRRTGHRST